MAGIPGTQGGLGRYNNIEVILVPNPLYTITDGNTLNEPVESVSLTPHQIRKVEIVKSYETHSTEVYITFDMLDPTAFSRISEGTYIIYLFINGYNNPGGASRFNYFVCDELVPLETTEVFGTYPALSARGRFSSITKIRLQYENIIPFELGGQGSTKAQGAGKTPFEFFENDLKKMYYSLYTDRSTESARASIFSTKFTTPNADTLIPMGPQDGYFINTKNNFEAFGYIFDHYPLFRTVYNWVLDDFCSEDANGSSTLFVSDLIRWDSWQNHIDENLSTLFNVSTGESENAFETLGLSTVIQAKQIDHSPFYNYFRYSIRDDLPKIYATDIHTHEPINTNWWNAVHAKKYLIYQSETGLGVKEMDNPLYKEYLTFLSGEEVENVQQYKKVFQALHPSLETYEFTNLFFGEVDLNSVIEIKRKNLSPENDFGFNRIGLCYQIKQTFERTSIMPPRIKDGDAKIKGPQDWLDDPSYTPTYIHSAEATFLMIDEGAKNLREFNALPQPVVDREFVISPDDLSQLNLNDPCESGRYDPELGTDGLGIPGNTSIVDQARAIESNNVRYVYGGHSAHAMDCSFFVQTAVHAAGADQGYGKRYPRTTADQYPWCLKNAIPIAFEHRQPGDIVFFTSQGKHHGHTGIFTGKETVIEASSSRGKVLERDLGRRKVSGVFRIVPKGSKPNKAPDPSTGG